MQPFQSRLVCLDAAMCNVAKLFCSQNLLIPTESLSEYKFSKLIRVNIKVTIIVSSYVVLNKLFFNRGFQAHTKTSPEISTPVYAR
jgi:hypothetical protein